MNLSPKTLAALEGKLAELASPRYAGLDPAEMLLSAEAQIEPTCRRAALVALAAKLLLDAEALQPACAPIDAELDRQCEAHERWLLVTSGGEVIGDAPPPPAALGVLCDSDGNPV